MDTVVWDQILNEAVCISNNAYTPGKDMNSIILIDS